MDGKKTSKLKPMEWQQSVHHGSMGILEGPAEVDRPEGRADGKNPRRCRKTNPNHAKHPGSTVKVILGSVFSILKK
jgi:hypothetical protein